jgi:hypothetical protein
MIDPREATRTIPDGDRPRDRYGRPLRAGADPLTAYPGVPTRSFVSAVDAWHEGLAFLAVDLPFHAHEVFEQRWKCAPASERDAWRSLAQWGAALTHSARGNVVGAQRLAVRASEGLMAATLVDPIDPEVVESSLQRLLAT